jgi:hypothetical protein
LTYPDAGVDNQLHMTTNRATGHCGDSWFFFGYVYFGA